MKRLFTITVVAGMAALVFAGWSLAATAEENYRFYCASCHGLEGRGDGPNATKNMPAAPRNFTSKKEMNKLTDQDLIIVIKSGGSATGRSTLMPPFGKVLSEQEIIALKDYLRKLCNCKGL